MRVFEREKYCVCVRESERETRGKRKRALGVYYLVPTMHIPTEYVNESCDFGKFMRRICTYFCVLVLIYIYINLYVHNKYSLISIRTSIHVHAWSR